MLWVKGELLTHIDAPGVDPTNQLDRSTQPNLFYRRDWFRRVWRHGGGTPLIARAASEGALCWLFLNREGGGRVSGLSNWYSFAVGPIFSGDPDPARQRAMLIAIAKRLRTARPAISSITLSPMPEASAEVMQSAFRKAGWMVSTAQSSTSWTADVADMDFDAYWAARPGQLRSTFKRKQGKANFDTQILTHFDESAWAAYEAIYADSWKPEEGSPALLRELAMAEGEADALRLGICRIDGEAVAAQFWTVDHGIALIHKLAHRESAKDLSPGTILSHALFRHVIDIDKVGKIDFGTGDDAYKADWMDASAPLMRFEACNPATMSGLAKAARGAVSRLVRRNAGG